MEETESVLEVAPAFTPSPGEIRPRPPAGEMDVEEAALVLAQGLLPHISGVEEIVTFQVRPGVTLMWDKTGKHQAVEVILRDKVMGFSVAQIAQKIETGTLDNFCQGVLGKLRSRLSFEPPIQYRRVDLLREILHQFETLTKGMGLELGSSSPQLRQGTASYYQEQITLIREAIQRRTAGTPFVESRESLHASSGLPTDEGLRTPRQRRPFEKRKS